MKIKSIRIIIVVLIGILTIYCFINYSSKSYDLLNIENQVPENIFNFKYHNSLKVNSAFCYENDTLYNLMLNNYRIIVWKLSRYQGLSSNNIDLCFSNDRNRDFYFTLSSEIEISPVLEIIYKIPDYLTENITLNISKRSEVYDTIRYMQNMGYYFNASRFGLGDFNKRSNIIFDFIKEKREVMLLLLNRNEQKYIIVLYSINNEKINCESFLRIFD